MYAFWIWCAAKDIRVMLDYVQSAYNPADEPSRDGTVNGIPVPLEPLPGFLDADDIVNEALRELRKAKVEDQERRFDRAT